MLPDYPVEKARLWKFWNLYLTKRVDFHSGFASMLSSYIHHEGSEYGMVQPEGELDSAPYEEIKGGFNLSLAEAKNFTPDKLAETIDSMAIKIARQMSSSLFKSINKATEESGKKLDLQGRELSPDDFIEMLERVTPSFNDDGEFQPPKVIMNPKLFAAYKDKFKEWEGNPEVTRKHNAMMARQKERWVANQANRKLVD